MVRTSAILSLFNKKLYVTALPNQTVSHRRMHLERIKCNYPIMGKDNDETITVLIGANVAGRLFTGKILQTTM